MRGGSRSQRVRLRVSSVGVKAFLGKDLQWRTLANKWTVPMLQGSAAGVRCRGETRFRCRGETRFRCRVETRFRCRGEKRFRCRDYSAPGQRRGRCR